LIEDFPFGFQVNVFYETSDPQKPDHRRWVEPKSLVPDADGLTPACILNPDLFPLLHSRNRSSISIPAADKAQLIRYRLKGYILWSSAQSNVGLAALPTIAGHQPG
jgi:hypothetical protein